MRRVGSTVRRLSGSAITRSAVGRETGRPTAGPPTVGAYRGPVSIEQAVLGFAVVAGLLTLVPGVDTALVLRTSLTRGRPEAFAAMAGIQAGTLLWGAAAGMGATALLAASEVAYRALTLLGAIYLVYLGIRLLVRRPSAQDVDTSATGRRRGLLGAWGTGLLTNLLNPKVGVFYLATIPQFVPDGVSPLVMGVVLAAVHCVLGAVWLGTIAVAGSAVGRRLRSAALMRWVDRVTGGVLVLMGARLALNARG